jgi:hypothetical protein
VSLLTAFVAFVIGGLTVFIAMSLWFFGLIDSGRIFYR